MAIQLLVVKLKFHDNLMCAYYHLKFSFGLIFSVFALSLRQLKLMLNRISKNSPTPLIRGASLDSLVIKMPAEFCSKSNQPTACLKILIKAKSLNLITSFSAACVIPTICKKIVSSSLSVNFCKLPVAKNSSPNQKPGPKTLESKIQRPTSIRHQSK
jgi:hypothetical protein